MSEYAVFQRVDQPEVVDRVLRIKGNAAASPTVEYGRGMTVTWISTGLYEIAFNENPGQYICFEGPNWEATTASALKGYSAVAGNWDATNFKLRVSVTNSSDTLADLTSVQWMSGIVKFSKEKPI